MKKKVVLIGGGHGLSNLVKGFKDQNIDLSIIVASTDDGGHTGKIRDEFDFVAVGDLRMVLNELIDSKSSLKEIFNYRFDEIHGVKKVSLGNLALVSLLMQYNNDIDKVIAYFKEREHINANIYLSSNTPVKLCAKCEDAIVKGECEIGESNMQISSLYSEGESICNKEMLKKIEEADIIVLGPGSLYTSVGAVLCIESIKKAIYNSKGEIVYVCNIMTQNGETLGYSVEDHEKALTDIIGKRIDRVIVNNGKIDELIKLRYEEENSDIVRVLSRKEYYEFYDLVEIIDNKVMHNSYRTMKIILGQ